MKSLRQQDGFTLLEVLIAMIIIAVGLLGIAALQTHAFRAETESYQRAQALVLLDDMAHRISANRTAAGCYALGTTDTTTPAANWLGTGYVFAYNCTTYGIPESQAIANADMLKWHNMLLGEAEKQGADNIGTMINARGCITVDNTGVLYTITVAWEGVSQGIAPTDPDACGSGLYGANDGWRRAVTRQVRLPNLTI